MILVTGGAGYIGSHCTLGLLKAGFEVTVFDSLELGHKETIDELRKTNCAGKLVDFIQGDLKNPEDIKKVLNKHQIKAVVHFAAYSQVAESVINPKKYYENNLIGTLNLLSAMLEKDIKKIVFSSTAATYGEPKYIPIDESHPQEPINPYGQTKLMIEKILEDYDKAYGFKSIRLRYFNVAGANSDSIIGEWHNPETHLIPNILKSTFINAKEFQMFGDDYDTKDGTCVRDYINIEDLVEAHILALKHLEKGGETNYFNLGTTEGSSVKEIFSACEEITGKNISVSIKPKRVGDPASLVADSNKAKEILNWKPKKTIQDSIKTAYKWEEKLQNKLNNT